MAEQRSDVDGPNLTFLHPRKRPVLSGVLQHALISIQGILQFESRVSANQGHAYIYAVTSLPIGEHRERAQAARRDDGIPDALDANFREKESENHVVYGDGVVVIIQVLV